MSYQAEPVSLSAPSRFAGGQITDSIYDRQKKIGEVIYQVPSDKASIANAKLNAVAPPSTSGSSSSSSPYSALGDFGKAAGGLFGAIKEASGGGSSTSGLFGSLGGNLDFNYDPNAFGSNFDWGSSINLNTGIDLSNISFGG